jgi:hypothetical protein
MKPSFTIKAAFLPLILCVLCAQLPGQTRLRAGVPVQSHPGSYSARNLRILGFTLGKDTLADVEAKLGKSTARRCSSEEEASKELCYLTRKGQTRVVFESGSSGGWKVLDGYKVIAGNLHRSCYSQCPRASQVNNGVQTGGGLRLGLTRKQLIALLGPPGEIRGNKLIFEWESRRAMTKAEEEAESKTFNEPITDAYWDVQDTIEVTLADSKAVEFAVDHVVSY